MIAEQKEQLTEYKKLGEDPVIARIRMKMKDRYMDQRSVLKEFCEWLKDHEGNRIDDAPEDFLRNKNDENDS